MKGEAKSYLYAERNSPSDTELICLSILVDQGSYVVKGKPVLELEGAKTVFEIGAETDGFFYAFVEEGDHLAIGTVIGLISEIEIEDIETFKTEQRANPKSVSEDNVLNRMSNPARDYVLSNPLSSEESDLLSAEVGLITLENLMRILTKSKTVNKGMTEIESDYWNNFIKASNALERCVLIGGGRGAVQVLDLLQTIKKYLPIGYISDSWENYLKVPLIPRLGDTSEESIVRIMAEQKVDNFILTGGPPSFRSSQLKIFKNLGVPLVTLLHPSVLVGSNVTIGNGTLIFANVYIGPMSKIGEGCFISANSSLDHHTEMGIACTTGPLLVLSGGVNVGDEVKFGMNIGVEPGIKIGSSSLIASGVILTRDVPANTTIKGKSS